MNFFSPTLTETQTVDNSLCPVEDLYNPKEILEQRRLKWSEMRDSALARQEQLNRQIRDIFSDCDNENSQESFSKIGLSNVSFSTYSGHGLTSRIDSSIDQHEVKFRSKSSYENLGNFGISKPRISLNDLPINVESSYELAAQQPNGIMKAKERYFLREFYKSSSVTESELMHGNVSDPINRQRQIDEKLEETREMNFNAKMKMKAAKQETNSLASNLYNHMNGFFERDDDTQCQNLGGYSQERTSYSSYDEAASSSEYVAPYFEKLLEKSRGSVEAERRRSDELLENVFLQESKNFSSSASNALTRLLEPGRHPNSEFSLLKKKDDVNEKKAQPKETFTAMKSRNINMMGVEKQSSVRNLVGKNTNKLEQETERARKLTEEKSKEKQLNFSSIENRKHHKSLKFDERKAEEGKFRNASNDEKSINSDKNIKFFKEYEQEIKVPTQNLIIPRLKMNTLLQHRKSIKPKNSIEQEHTTNSLEDTLREDRRHINSIFAYTELAEPSVKSKLKETINVTSPYKVCIEDFLKLQSVAKNSHSSNFSKEVCSSTKSPLAPPGKVKRVASSLLLDRTLRSSLINNSSSAAKNNGINPANNNSNTKIGKEKFLINNEAEDKSICNAAPPCLSAAPDAPPGVARRRCSSVLDECIKKSFLFRVNKENSELSGNCSNDNNVDFSSVSNDISASGKSTLGEHPYLESSISKFSNDNNLRETSTNLNSKPTVSNKNIFFSRYVQNSSNSENKNLMKSIDINSYKEDTACHASSLNDEGINSNSVITSPILKTTEQIKRKNSSIFSTTRTNSTADFLNINDSASTGNEIVDFNNSVVKEKGRTNINKKSVESFKSLFKNIQNVDTFLEDNKTKYTMKTSGYLGKALTLDSRVDKAKKNEEEQDQHFYLSDTLDDMKKFNLKSEVLDERNSFLNSSRQAIETQAKKLNRYDKSFFFSVVEPDLRKEFRKTTEVSSCDSKKKIAENFIDRIKHENETLDECETSESVTSLRNDFSVESSEFSNKKMRYRSKTSSWKHEEKEQEREKKKEKKQKEKKKEKDFIILNDENYDSMHENDFSLIKNGMLVQNKQSNFFVDAWTEQIDISSYIGKKNVEDDNILELSDRARKILENNSDECNRNASKTTEKFLSETHERRVKRKLKNKANIDDDADQKVEDEKSVGFHSNDNKGKKKTKENYYCYYNDFSGNSNCFNSCEKQRRDKKEKSGNKTKEDSLSKNLEEKILQNILNIVNKSSTNENNLTFSAIGNTCYNSFCENSSSFSSVCSSLGSSCDLLSSAALSERSTIISCVEDTNAKNIAKNESLKRTNKTRKMDSNLSNISLGLRKNNCENRVALHDTNIFGSSSSDNDLSSLKHFLITDRKSNKQKVKIKTYKSAKKEKLLGESYFTRRRRRSSFYADTHKDLKVKAKGKTKFISSKSDLLLPDDIDLSVVNSSPSLFTISYVTSSSLGDLDNDGWSNINRKREGSTAITCHKQNTKRFRYEARKHLCERKVSFKHNKKRNKDKKAVDSNCFGDAKGEKEVNFSVSKEKKDLDKPFSAHKMFRKRFFIFGDKGFVVKKEIVQEKKNKCIYSLFYAQKLKKKNKGLARNVFETCGVSHNKETKKINCDADSLSSLNSKLLIVEKRNQEEEKKNIMILLANPIEVGKKISSNENLNKTLTTQEKYINELSEDKKYKLIGFQSSPFQCELQSSNSNSDLANYYCCSSSSASYYSSLFNISQGLSELSNARNNYSSARKELHSCCKEDTEECSLQNLALNANDNLVTPTTFVSASDEHKNKNANESKNACQFRFAENYSFIHPSVNTVFLNKRSCNISLNSSINNTAFSEKEKLMSKERDLIGKKSLDVMNDDSFNFIFFSVRLPRLIHNFLESEQNNEKTPYEEKSFESFFSCDSSYAMDLETDKCLESQTKIKLDKDSNNNKLTQKRLSFLSTLFSRGKKKQETVKKNVKEERQNDSIGQLDAGGVFLHEDNDKYHREKDLLFSQNNKNNKNNTSFHSKNIKRSNSAQFTQEKNYYSLFYENTILEDKKYKSTYLEIHKFISFYLRQKMRQILQISMMLLCLMILVSFWLLIYFILTEKKIIIIDEDEQVLLSNNNYKIAYTVSLVASFILFFFIILSTVGLTSFCFIKKIKKFYSALQIELDNNVYTDILKQCRFFQNYSCVTTEDEKQEAFPCVFSSFFPSSSPCLLSLYNKQKEETSMNAEDQSYKIICLLLNLFKVNPPSFALTTEIDRKIFSCWLFMSNIFVLLIVFIIIGDAYLIPFHRHYTLPDIFLIIVAGFYFLIGLLLSLKITCIPDVYTAILMVDSRLAQIECWINSFIDIFTLKYSLFKKSYLSIENTNKVDRNINKNKLCYVDENIVKHNRKLGSTFKRCAKINSKIKLYIHPELCKTFTSGIRARLVSFHVVLNKNTSALSTKQKSDLKTLEKRIGVSQRVIIYVCPANVSEYAMLRPIQTSVDHSDDLNMNKQDTKNKENNNSGHLYDLCIVGYEPQSFCLQIALFESPFVYPACFYKSKQEVKKKTIRRDVLLHKKKRKYGCSVCRNFAKEFKECFFFLSYSEDNVDSDSTDEENSIKDEYDDVVNLGNAMSIYKEVKANLNSCFSDKIVTAQDSFNILRAIAHEKQFIASPDTLIEKKKNLISLTPLKIANKHLLTVSINVPLEFTQVHFETVFRPLMYIPRGKINKFDLLFYVKKSQEIFHDTFDANHKSSVTENLHDISNTHNTVKNNSSSTLNNNSVDYCDPSLYSNEPQKNFLPSSAQPYVFPYSSNQTHSISIASSLVINKTDAANAATNDNNDTSALHKNYNHSYTAESSRDKEETQIVSRYRNDECHNSSIILHSNLLVSSVQKNKIKNYSCMSEHVNSDINKENSNNNETDLKENIYGKNSSREISLKNNDQVISALKKSDKMNKSLVKNDYVLDCAINAASNKIDDMQRGKVGKKKSNKDYEKKIKVRFLKHPPSSAIPLCKPVDHSRENSNPNYHYSYCSGISNSVAYRKSMLGEFQNDQMPSKDDCFKIYASNSNLSDKNQDHKCIEDIELQRHVKDIYKTNHTKKKENNRQIDLVSHSISNTNNEANNLEQQKCSNNKLCEKETIQEHRKVDQAVMGCSVFTVENKRSNNMHEYSTNSINNECSACCSSNKTIKSNYKRAIKKFIFSQSAGSISLSFLFDSLEERNVFLNIAHVINKASIKQK